MLILRFVLLVSVVCLGTMVSAGLVSGQAYPNKPIRIVTTPAPGINDTIARIINQGITGPLGQPLIMEYRPAGVIPGETVAKAAPDGYTLLFTGSSLWRGSLFGKTPYDVLRDFAPITFVSSAPTLLVVHPSVPAKSVKELVALAKARPGELNYGSGATGATAHLSAELFKSMARVDIVRVPYTNNTTRFTDLVSGQIQLTFATEAEIGTTIKSGRLRSLGVTSAKPSALFPGIPTIAEAVTGFESVSMQGMFAPAKTPEAIITRLNQEIVRVLSQADVKERLLSMGVEATPSSPEESVAKIKAELADMRKIIKDAGIKVD